MSNETSVDVALAVYDSARHLDAQMDSLLSQSHSGLRVIARDDGSSDDSRGILRAYASRSPDRVTLLTDGRGNVGAIRNFSTILDATTAPYVMFCDADDVWRPDKVARLLAETRRIESEIGADRPVLVHCDLVVVDDALEEIASSMWQHQHLDPSDDDLRRLLVHNPVTGSSTLMNRALVDLALPIPREAMMHDWWVALVAAATGRIGRVNAALTLYRQHGENVLGAERYGLRHIAERAATLFADGGLRDLLGRTFRQAATLDERVGDRMTPADRALVRLWASLEHRGALARRVALARGRYRIPGAARKVGLLLAI